jgi:hypothetical protein
MKDRPGWIYKRTHQGPGWVFKRRHKARVEFKKRQLAAAIEDFVDRVIEKHNLHTTRQS